MRRTEEARSGSVISLRQIRALRYSCDTVPRISITTGVCNADGRQETLTEYMCDAPGCPNVAVEVLGAARGLGVFFAVCEEHIPAKHS